MDIPLNAEVSCTDGVCGHSSCIVINPISKDVTHFVVQTRGLLHLEYLVPVSYISASTPSQIQLDCTRDTLAKLEPFRQTEFVKLHDPTYLITPPRAFDLGAENVYLWPYVEPEGGSMRRHAGVEQIPYAELGIHRGANVEATDGFIGHVDEFVIDSSTNHITHLVLREGHLWGTKDVTVPVSQIDRMEEDVVYLKLAKRQVEELPSVPVERWWRGG